MLVRLFNVMASPEYGTHDADSIVNLPAKFANTLIEAEQAEPFEQFADRNGLPKKVPMRIADGGELLLTANHADPEAEAALVKEVWAVAKPPVDPDADDEGDEDAEDVEPDPARRTVYLPPQPGPRGAVAASPSLAVPKGSLTEDDHAPAVAPAEHAKGTAKAQSQSQGDAAVLHKPVDHLLEPKPAAKRGRPRKS